MDRSRQLNLVSIAGILVFGLALVVAHLTYPYFWTSRAMARDEPWYFIGRTFVGAACAAAGLLVTVVLGLATQARLGREVWIRLMTPFLFLSYPVGQGVNVILHTDRIWEESAASTPWKTFDEYQRSDATAMFATLAITAAVMFYLVWPIGSSKKP